LIAKDNNNTRIFNIRSRGVPFRFTSIKLYYKDVNPEYNNFINNITNNPINGNRPNTQLNNILNDELKRNLTRKRGRPKKFDQFITSYETFLQLND
jgi:hypothetical protein